ncbi:MAG: twin-arginine translocase TatA/TatE family subunit [Polyangiales bacterium]
MGATELIVVGLIIVLLFGAAKLPELGRAVGEGVSNLKRGLREANEDPGKPAPPRDGDA